MPLSEETAERALARQKAWATGLVVLCALVFVAAMGGLVFDWTGAYDAG